MTKMGRLKKGDIFKRIAYELFGVKIGEDEELVPSAGVAAKQDGKHPAAQKPAPVVPAPEPVKPAPAVATTYIAPGTELTGTLKTDSNVEICGKFEGDIISTGTVLLRADHHGNVTAKQLELNGKSMQGDATVSDAMTIGEGSVITGNLVVGTLICRGIINGDVQCSGDVTLGKTARVTGNIQAATITMEKGCSVKGNITVS